MSEDPSCDATYRDQVGRTMARSMLTTLTTDTDPETIDATTTRYGRPWQVLVAIGDAYYERKDWANAVKVYEEALDDMRDIVANPTAPPADVEKRTYKRAVEARALAPIFVATRQFRGQKTGLASPNFRNFTAEAVPVPVQFEYDSDVLTENGVAAVTDIFAYVKDAAPEHLVITGHTDPRGSEAYNADLSLRRGRRRQGIPDRPRLCRHDRGLRRGRGEAVRAGRPVEIFGRGALRLRPPGRIQGSRNSRAA